MSDFRPHVLRAVKLLGSQTRLAEAIGISQSEVSRLCTSAKSIPPETALSIARVTAGAVSLKDLLPDVVEAIQHDLQRGAA